MTRKDRLYVERLAAAFALSTGQDGEKLLAERDSVHDVDAQSCIR